MSWDIEADARLGVGQRLQGAFREGQALSRRCGPSWGSERPPRVHVSEEQSQGPSPPEARLSEGRAERAGLARGAATQGSLAHFPRPARPEATRPSGKLEAGVTGHSHIWPIRPNV